MNSSDKTRVSWPSNLGTMDDSTRQQLCEQSLPGFLSLLSAENIAFEPSLEQIHNHLYVPFCAWLSEQHKNTPLIIGINGSQGSGKSTLSKILKQILEKSFNKQVAILSIDDLYKTRQQREQLAKDVHPLFSTRGVPGTHDVELGIKLIKQLIQNDNSEIKIPVFEKAIDDRADESDWISFNGQPDIILFEGWCVGSIAEDDEQLLAAMNELEREEDADAKWRNHVNEQLKADYQDLFSLIDILLLLKIPDFNKVYEWRKLQESKLRQRIENEASSSHSVMSDHEVERFIMHYERLTRHTLNEMPERCDIVFELGDDHHIKNVMTRYQ